MAEAEPSKTVSEQAQSMEGEKKDDDQELDDLLDSALEDFDKPPPAGATAAAEEANPQHAASKGDGAPADPTALFEELFSGGEVADPMQRQMADAMKVMMSDEPDLVQHLERLAQAANTADESEESQRLFTDTLQETLDSLSQNTQNLQGELSEEDVVRAMSSLGLEEGMGEGDTDFLPMMQGMMKSLLSKEVLYPSLKEISTKYPAWLVEHKEELQASEYDKYEKQYSLMQRICHEFEQDSGSETDDVKRQRFEKILELMQQMQECGQPPKDIVGEMMPGVEFDEHGNPRLPNMSEQCSIM